MLYGGGSQEGMEREWGKQQRSEGTSLSQRHLL